MSEARDTATDRTLFYEDLAYGRVFTAGPRTVTEDDLLDFARISGDHNPIHVDEVYAAGTLFGKRVVHGPLGLALVFGLMHDIGVLERSAIAVLDANWRFVGPIFVGDALSMDMTITARRLTSSGTTGIVGRHVIVRKAASTVVQEGTLGLMVRVEDAERARREDAERPSPGTLPWGRRIAEIVNDDPAFVAGARAFDGVVALRAGASEVALKIFEGQVLKVARRLPSGATFTLSGAELAWVELLAGERNEFMAMATRGSFEVSGNVYEYLRITRALMAILNAARGVS